jgi:hypothetical protein
MKYRLGNIDQNVDYSSGRILRSVNGKTYFQTNSTNPSDNYGSPGVLDVTRNDGRKVFKLSFPSSNYDLQEVTTSSTEMGDTNNTKQVLAKNAAEAKANAFNILVAANQIANGDFEAPVGNLVKAFFEIRKMYPEYMRMNPLFSSFLQGLSTGWINPQLTGDIARIQGAPELKKRLGDETKKALQEIGVIKAS